ncbi:MAG TPA: hypothetical protein PLH20_00810 [Flavobacterium sp.]|jgi:hypothetical protein|nr:hypothetical protein [Flavobacterium sp.]
MCYNNLKYFLDFSMPYSEFQRLIGKAGLTIKEFAELLEMNPNSITNYHKVGIVPSHIAIIISLISTMKDKGLDFYEIFEKLKEYDCVSDERDMTSE